MSRLVFALAAAALAGAAAAPASAGVVMFSGTRFNIDAPGPQAARCGARTTINIRQSATSVSTGTSNFGDFTPTLSHCIQLPVPAPFDLGEFLFEFALGDTLFGTYSGEVTANMPGLFNVSQTHIVTGGTGRFLNASGSFFSSGTILFQGGPPQVSQTFSGQINAPAIPEPGVWALMIGGFGLTGAALRRRRQTWVLAPATA